MSHWKCIIFLLHMAKCMICYLLAWKRLASLIKFLRIDFMDLLHYLQNLKMLWKLGIFFFFLENFNLWRSLLMIAFYYQIKTPIGFWCRRGLNPRSLIQPSKTLPVELTRTHDNWESWCKIFLTIIGFEDFENVVDIWLLKHLMKLLGSKLYILNTFNLWLVTRSCKI